jgi:hypothetical protein
MSHLASGGNGNSLRALGTQDLAEAERQKQELKGKLLLGIDSAPKKQQHGAISRRLHPACYVTLSSNSQRLPEGRRLSRCECRGRLL